MPRKGHDQVVVAMAGASVRKHQRRVFAEGLLPRRCMGTTQLGGSHACSTRLRPTTPSGELVLQGDAGIRMAVQRTAGRHIGRDAGSGSPYVRPAGSPARGGRNRLPVTMLPDVRFPKESHRNSPDRLQLADQTVRLPAEVPDGLRRAVQESLNRRVEDRPHSVQEYSSGARPFGPWWAGRPMAVSPGRQGLLPIHHD